MFHVLQKKYQEDFENTKDQIYFMQTETPEYKVNKQAGVAASKVWAHPLIGLDLVSVWGNFLQFLLFYIMGGRGSYGNNKKIFGDYHRATNFKKKIAM